MEKEMEKTKPIANTEPSSTVYVCLTHLLDIFTWSR